MAVPPERLKAVIYLPAMPDAEVWRQRCLTHVERRGYELVAIIEDGGPDVWRQLSRMAAEGEHDVVVMGSRAHLDPDRVPRYEAVDEDQPPGPRWRRAARLVRPR